MTLGEVKDIAIIVGVLTGAGSLVAAALSLALTHRINRAKFWIDLRAAFARHDEVHRRLRPGGDWQGGTGPETPQEFADIEAYMGLFEHCEIMLSQGLIDAPTFREIYRYRLQNLMSCEWVRIEKICRRPEGWKRFIDLLKRMKIDYRC